MNAKDQIKWMDTFTGKMKEICLKKGDDYANDDRLSNFKKVGAMVNQDAQMPILVLMATKVARLSELLTGNKVPNNESIEDSFLDLANYAALGYMLHKEKKEEALRELAAQAQELGLGYTNSPSDTDTPATPGTHVVPMAGPLGLQEPFVASPDTKRFEEDLVISPTDVPFYVRTEEGVPEGPFKRARTTFTPIIINRHLLAQGWRERYARPQLFDSMPEQDRKAVVLALNAAVGASRAAGLGAIKSVRLANNEAFDA